MLHPLQLPVRWEAQGRLPVEGCMGLRRVAVPGPTGPGAQGGCPLFLVL